MSYKVVLIAADEDISYGFRIGLDFDSHPLSSRAHAITDRRFVESVDGHDLQGVKWQEHVCVDICNKGLRRYSRVGGVVLRSKQSLFFSSYDDEQY